MLGFRPDEVYDALLELLTPTRTAQAESKTLKRIRNAFTQDELRIIDWNRRSTYAEVQARGAMPPPPPLSASTDPAKQDLRPRTRREVARSTRICGNRTLPVLRQNQGRSKKPAREMENIKKTQPGNNRVRKPTHKPLFPNLKPKRTISYDLDLELDMILEELGVSTDDEEMKL